MDTARLKAAVRDIPDFPKPGIVFKDIAPILGDPALFRQAVDLFVERHRAAKIAKVAVIDARGFLFGSAVAYALGAGVVPIRKKGKLPFATHEETCTLEYGTATLAIHTDAFRAGERVLLLDDLLATGGTALAAANLIRRAGGELVEIDFLIELAFLKGRDRLAGFPVFTAVCF